jgi:hypothetical protein
MLHWQTNAEEIALYWTLGWSETHAGTARE